MFQPPPKTQFSFNIFTLLSHLIHLSQTINSSLPNPNQTISQIEEHFHQTPYNKYDIALFNFLKYKAINNPIINHNQYYHSQNNTFLTQSFKSFLNSFSQSKLRILNLQAIAQNLHLCQFIIADHKKLYSIKQQLLKKQLKSKDKSHSINVTEYKPSQFSPITNSNRTKDITYRAFVIYGKAVNVQKHKKNQTQTQSSNQVSPSSPQDITFKQQTISSLQFCMAHLYNDQKLPYVKSQPHQLDDILLTHYLDDSSLLPILVTHQVYKLFVPIEDAIILLIPEDLLDNAKPQIPSIIKNTVLHVYMDNYRVLCKTIAKESFFKNTVFRGIYFVEEGEVETKSGRVVARGWVINGKCKSTSQVCKFTKIMTFFKYVLQNQNVWKQFVNDLKLNGEWPIKVSDILNLDQKILEELMGQEATTFKLQSSNPRQKHLKFPPITSRLTKSFDISKLAQIQKLKHYDEKMNHLHEFKQEMLKRKIQMGSKKNSVHYDTQASEDASEKQMNKRIQILTQKMNLPQKGLKTDISKSMILRPGESSANILVAGIVQKLKNIHDGSEGHSLQRLDSHKQSKRQLIEESRSKTKILGLKRYEEVLKNEKSHLFKGKNFYH